MHHRLHRASLHGRGWSRLDRRLRIVDAGHTDVQSNGSRAHFRVRSAAGADVVTTVRVDIANQFCPLPLVIDRMVFTIYDESLRSEQRFQVRYVFLP